MKTLIVSALFLSTSVMAHDTHFSGQSCDIDLNAGLKIKQNVVEFTKNGDSLYKIVDNQTLYIGDQEITLNTNQQVLVTEYSESIRAVVPEVKEIAEDAIELAVDGVNLAFTELLGEGSKVATDLTSQLYGIKDEVSNRFDDQDFHIDDNGNFHGEAFGDELEEKIERIVEDTIKNSMGTLLIAVGQELLFAGGDMEAFEAKMEKFGEQIEYEMEERGEEFEQRAEELCRSVKNIDELEEQLKETISQMPSIDVLITEKDKRNKA